MGIPLPWIWSWDPQIVIGLALAAVLYTRGLVYTKRAGLTRRISPWRPLAYGLGLLSIFVALESPIDAWSEMYLTAHMLQHELLMFVAAPLLVLSAPLMPLWRAVPLAARRDSLRWGLRHPRLRHGGLAFGRTLSAPAVVWVLFVGDFIGWHFPIFYDLALRNQTVHDLEHALFLGTALLFWSQLITSHPLRPHLDYGDRALYVFFAVMAMGVVSLAFVFIPTPIYGFYAAHHLAGAPSAVVDQNSAGGLMNASSVAVFGTTFMLLLWKWLEQDEARSVESLDYPKYRPGPAVSPPVPTFHGRPLRWQPIVLSGAAQQQPASSPEPPVAADG